MSWTKVCHKFCCETAMLIDPPDLYIECNLGGFLFCPSFGHIFPSDKNMTQKGVKIPTKIQQREGTLIFFFPTSTTKNRRFQKFHTLEFPCFPWSKVVLLFILFVAVFLELPNQHLQRCRFIYLWFWCLLGQRLEKMDWVTHHKSREKSNNKMSTDSKKPSSHCNMDHWTQSFPMDSVNQMAVWKLLPSKSQDANCKFSESVLFADFCCCFELWYLTALQHFLTNLIPTCCKCAPISSIAQKTMSPCEPPGWCLTKESGPGRESALASGSQKVVWISGISWFFCNQIK